MRRSDEPLDPAVVVRAAVDVLVFAPLGLGVMLIEDAPRAVGRARRELSNARFIGRFAVDQGLTQVREKLESPSPVEHHPPAERTTARDDRVASKRPEPTPIVDAGDLSADDLALPDYDTLPAVDIVVKLESLTTDEREAIGRYEGGHRRRRTILGKLAQLAEQ